MLHLEQTDLDCTWCSSNSGSGRIFNNCVVLRACIGGYVMDFGRCVSLTRLKRRELRKINVECGNQNLRLLSYFVKIVRAQNEL